MQRMWFLSPFFYDQNGAFRQTIFLENLNNNIKENGAKICLKKSEYQELNNCESVSVFYEGEKNYICNKCANNSE